MASMRGRSPFITAGVKPLLRARRNVGVRRRIPQQQPAPHVRDEVLELGHLIVGSSYDGACGTHRGKPRIAEHRQTVRMTKDTPVASTRIEELQGGAIQWDGDSADTDSG